MDISDKILFVDVESLGDGRIHKIGAVLGDRKLSSTECGGVQAALLRLDEMAVNATALGGHNIVAHDHPLLMKLNPRLKLFDLSVVDTLHLSPICFPENPYHHLVKDYKLVSQSVSNPLDDALLSRRLFEDELVELQRLRDGDPEFFATLAFLTSGGSDAVEAHSAGMQWLFDSLKPGVCKQDAGAALDNLKSVLLRYACRTAVLTLESGDVASQDYRWAMVFALSWLRVAGGDSVLPAWVRFSFPLCRGVLQKLRDVPCDDSECAYCNDVHNPEKQLKRFFGFDAFRPEPKSESGGSLQRHIALTGMRNESLLAILPTGGGKSLCYQLPAIVRHIRRGELTIVISPLQALMKDQVGGLVRRTGMDNAAALYGMLTMPERADVMRRVKAGNIAILYVSPEQLRNDSFFKTVSQREIGCWVIDEAHCLSKWGHDFRPDYLYIGKVIKKLAETQHLPPPPVGCFTATAKQDVVDEIVNYFQSEIGGTVSTFRGGVERNNLRFEVQTVNNPTKFAKVNDLLHERLGNPGSPAAGCGIVFRATQRATEELAEYLSEQGWSAAHFHAGIPVPEKKRVQDEFIGGAIQVICATNAFGMGIDKDDVRVVIHADTPGSLENYLQEAGRAGRDRKPADCILLYDEEDCEQQFRLGAYSELRRKDIAQILRGLRKVSGQGNEVVITTGELLRDEDVETSFFASDKSADTKVRTAVSWLERAGFVERTRNKTQVIQARLTVGSMDEAARIVAKLSISEREKRLWLAVAGELMNREAEQSSLTVDEIAGLPEFQSYMMNAAAGFREGEEAGRSHEFLSNKVLKTLNAMAQAGLLKKDTLLNAFVRYKISDSSRDRLARIVIIEEKFIDLLREEEPDPDPEGYVSLNLRGVNQMLNERGHDSSVMMLKDIVRSISEDGRGFAGRYGSIDVFPYGKDQYRLRMRRNWDQIVELSKRRAHVASVILTAIFEKIPPKTKPGKELLVEFSFEELLRAVDSDLELRSQLKDKDAAVERALLFLHEQSVIILQQGLAIFRSAMTIRVLPEAKGQRYTKHHYQALQYHYHERVFQVHVMSEYAKYGMEKIQQALNLIVAYFQMGRYQFIENFFPNRQEDLERATTAASYQRIVEDLGNRDQMRIVCSPLNRNILILAGPGSGKTRAVVHRCAYLLRVARVRSRGILVCCFNHNAAMELRRRLYGLAGDDARGVTVQTYHGLAMRLLGLSVADMNENNRESLDFDQLLKDAVALLEGEKTLAGMEADETRDRLLAGYEHILVDEYQDIDEMQYRMISAIAGRTLNDPDRKLSICAVGDDDQSIYGFRGANVTFLKRFQDDFKAEIHYLVDNYRSSQCIIDAANHLIALNRDRMKVNKPIQIDRARRGRLEQRSGIDKHPLTGGKVGVVTIADARQQAVSMVAEVERLISLKGVEPKNIAILSRNRDDLVVVRELAEAKGIPVTWLAVKGSMPPLSRIREFHQLFQVLEDQELLTCTASGLKKAVIAYSPSVWRDLLLTLLDEWMMESRDEEIPVALHRNYIYEALALCKGTQRLDRGVVLSTVHAVKGMEFDHVLLGGRWSGGRSKRELEEERRVFYTGMTRARCSLSIFLRNDTPNPFASDLVGAFCIQRSEVSDIESCGEAHKVEYKLLGLKDIYLDYAGYRKRGNDIHARLAQLSVGAKLDLALDGDRLLLMDEAGGVVAALSAAARYEWGSLYENILDVRVQAMYERLKKDVKEEKFQRGIRIDKWEIPVCEIKFLRPLAKAPRCKGILLRDARAIIS
ncbi:MAG: RecQ family ATP-dependent DNA helicase [Kiritimatiellia bacterium]